MSAATVATVRSEAAGQAIALGGRLRQIRTRNGDTLASVAAAAGMTTGHLSRIERGEKLPSMGALLRLSATLGVPLGELAGGAPVEGELAVVLAGERTSMQLNGIAAPRYDVILQQAACAGQSVTAYVLDPASNLDAITPTFHSGLEFVFVLEGGLTLQVADRVQILRAGDATLFPGYLKHMLGPLDPLQRSRALIVIVSPP